MMRRVSILAVRITFVAWTIAWRSFAVVGIALILFGLALHLRSSWYWDDVIIQFGTNVRMVCMSGSGQVYLRVEFRSPPPQDAIWVNLGLVEQTSINHYVWLAQRLATGEWSPSRSWTGRQSVDDEVPGAHTSRGGVVRAARFSTWFISVVGAILAAPLLIPPLIRLLLSRRRIAATVAPVSRRRLRLISALAALFTRIAVVTWAALWRGIAAMGLLVAMIFAVIDVRSYRQNGDFHFEYETVDSPSIVLHATATTGSLNLHIDFSGSLGTRSGEWNWSWKEVSVNPSWTSGPLFPSLCSFKAQRWYSAKIRNCDIIVPLWFLVVAGLIIGSPLLFSFVSWLRRRRFLGECMCKRCGYDLRGTPDRCPECGAAAKTDEA